MDICEKTQEDIKNLNSEDSQAFINWLIINSDEYTGNENPREFADLYEMYFDCYKKQKIQPLIKSI